MRSACGTFSAYHRSFPVLLPPRSSNAARAGSNAYRMRNGCPPLWTRSSRNAMFAPLCRTNTANRASARVLPAGKQLGQYHPARSPRVQATRSQTRRYIRLSMVSPSRRIIAYCLYRPQWGLPPGGSPCGRPRRHHRERHIPSFFIFTFQAVRPYLLVCVIRPHVGPALLRHSRLFCNNFRERRGVCYGYACAEQVRHQGDTV